MAKYRKKPVVIEAVQYTEYGKLVKGMCNSRSCFASGNTEPHVHTIHEGQAVNLAVGDWIIPEPDGMHYYPCKPDIFEATYEEEPSDERWTSAIENARFFLEEYRKIPTGMFGATVIAQAISRYENGERTAELLEELEGIQ